MAEKKQPYNWTLVRPGDIVSFRYKSIGSNTKLHTILVLNPRLPVRLKDGELKRQLIGIKLEESNRISLRLNARQIMLFEKIGEFLAKKVTTEMMGRSGRVVIEEWFTMDTSLFSYALDVESKLVSSYGGSAQTTPRSFFRTDVKKCWA